MNAASLLFIHQAMTSASGNPDELEKAASDLRTITEAAANAYKEGGVTCSEEKLAEMLRAETWLTAEDALRYGFATEIAESDTAEGVVTNDAMQSVIAAVTRKTPLEDIAARLERTVSALTAAGKPAENKGFFGLGGQK